MPENYKPLAGVKVLELSTMMAAPSCGKYLADWGAEVIKIEKGIGDNYRTYPPTMGIPSVPDCSPLYDNVNGGKRGICPQQRNRCPQRHPHGAGGQRGIRRSSGGTDQSEQPHREHHGAHHGGGADGVERKERESGELFRDAFCGRVEREHADCDQREVRGIRIRLHGGTGGRQLQCLRGSGHLCG